MENILSKYLKEIDNGDFNHTNKFEIDSELQKIRDELRKNGDIKNAELAQLEMEIFSFSKRIEDGKFKLSFKVAGTTENEKGEEKPFEWPDSELYNFEDYDYILKRFYETQNDYCKCEYGFVLIYGKGSPHKSNTLVIGLLESLFSITEQYYKLLEITENDEKHLSNYFINIVKYLFYISKQRKNNVNEIERIFSRSIKFVYEVIEKLNINYNWSYRLIKDLTELIVDNLNDFRVFDLKIPLNKLWDASNKLSTINFYGAIDFAKIGDIFEIKINRERNNRWQRLIAENYEKLAIEANKNNDISFISFIEDALKAYKVIKDREKINELEKLFFNNKSKIKGSIIESDFPDDFTKILEQIKEYINNATENDILITLIGTPMIRKLSVIREEYKDIYTIAPLSAMITKTIVDKMGNTIAEFNYKDKEAIDYFNLVQSYDFYFQGSIQEIRYFFWQSLLTKKLKYDNVSKMIENSWLGSQFNKYYNGNLHEIKINKVLDSSLKYLFNEFDKSLKDENYEMDLVMPIDSLTIKFEYIFRYFCEKLEIPTYKDIKGTSLKEERSINSLLEDKKVIEIFKKAYLEDDLFLFRFILTDKASNWNLRNRVAHGLMDFEEYDINKAIMLVIIILKLSSYNININK